MGRRHRALGSSDHSGQMLRLYFVGLRISLPAFASPFSWMLRVLVLGTSAFVRVVRPPFVRGVVVDRLVFGRDGSVVREDVSVRLVPYRRVSLSVRGDVDLPDGISVFGSDPSTLPLLASGDRDVRRFCFLLR